MSHQIPSYRMFSWHQQILLSPKSYQINTGEYIYIYIYQVSTAFARTNILSISSYHRAFGGTVSTASGEAGAAGSKAWAGSPDSRCCRWNCLSINYHSCGSLSIGQHWAFQLISCTRSDRTLLGALLALLFRNKKLLGAPGRTTTSSNKKLLEATS